MSRDQDHDLLFASLGQREVDRYVRPLRAVAVFVAIVAATWEIASWGMDPVILKRLAVLRVFETTVALVVAWAATPRRSIAALQALVWVLALDVAVCNMLVTWIYPTGAMEALLVQSIVIVGAAGLAPWSWRHQAALAAIVIAGSGAAVLLWVPETVLPGITRMRTILSLLTVGGVSLIVTALRGADRRLVTESEERFRGLYEAAGDAIAVLDTSGRIRHGNPRLAELLGRPIEAVRGTPLHGILRFQTGEQLQPVDAVRFARAAVAAEVVEGVIVRGGEERQVEVVFSLLSGGGSPEMLAILRDRSARRTVERRQAEERRIEAVSRLAGGLAHQFNNLLGGILTEASLLRDEAVGPDVGAGLERIRDTARRGAQLTDTLIRLTPNTTVTTLPVPASDVCRRVAERVEVELPRVPLAFDVAADLPLLAADAGHLSDALVELVRNAAAALGGRQEPVRVAVRTEQVGRGDTRWIGALPGTYVRLTVEDRGVGMDAATRTRLFEPFFTSRPMHESVGLGLATVHWVMRAHRGAIAVDSAPGRGTSIHLLIPVAADRADRATTPPSARARRTVLVADDEEMNRRTVVRALERFGYAALAVNDGPAALAALQENDPAIDAIVLDVVMPGSGPELVRQLRAVNPGVGILVCSGYGPEGAAAEMIGAGATQFLGKPFELNQLRDAVAEVLSP